MWNFQIGAVWSSDPPAERLQHIRVKQNDVSFHKRISVAACWTNYTPNPVIKWMLGLFCPIFLFIWSVQVHSQSSYCCCFLVMIHKCRMLILPLHRFAVGVDKKAANTFKKLNKKGLFEVISLCRWSLSPYWLCLILLLLRTTIHLLSQASRGKWRPWRSWSAGLMVSHLPCLFSSIPPPIHKVVSVHSASTLTGYPLTASCPLHPFLCFT